MPDVYLQDATAMTIVNYAKQQADWRIVRRAFASTTVEEGDVGVLIPYYNTTYATVPVYEFNKTSTGQAQGNVVELGVVEFNADDADSGAAGTFVDVVTQGQVVAKCMVGTVTTIATGDYLEYTTGAPGYFIKTTLGQTSKYCVGIALEAEAAGTEVTSYGTANVFLTRPLSIVNTSSVTEL